MALKNKDLREYEEFKKQGVRVGMMIDFYYQYNFNAPRQSRTDATIPFKNYNNRHNDFTLQLVEINFAKSFRSIDAYIDIDFGEMSDQNNYNRTNDQVDTVTRHIGQAFLRYNAKEWDGLAITGGKFYTHFGYEVPKTVDNKTYSRPIYYNLVCPFWHEGISITKSNMGPFGAGVYIYDQTDSRTERSNDKTYGAQLSFNSEKYSAVYNLITGPETTTGGDHEDKTNHELILTYRPTPRWTLVTDFVSGEEENGGGNSYDKEWFAFVGYIDYETHERNKVVVRYEKFDDRTDDAATSNLFGSTIPARTNSYTVTDRYNFNNGTEIRLEYRHDSSDQPIFPKGDTGSVKNQDTVTMAWVYSI